MIASVIIHLSDAAHLTIIQDTQRRGWKSNMPVSRRHPTLEASDMSVIERLAKTSFRIPAPSQSVLLVVVIAAYIFMHVVAGVMLINADLPLKFHPVEVRVSADVTPFGAG